MALLDAPIRDASGRDGAAPAREPRWRLLLLLFPALVAAGLAAGWLVDPGGHQSLVQYGDDVVRNFVLAHHTPGMEHLLRPVIQLGNVIHVAVIAAALSVLLLVLRRRWQALVPLVAVAGTDVMVGYLKYTINRPGTEWPHPGEPAFPSGHMSGITALVVPLAVLAWTTRRWWWPAVIAGASMVAMAAALLVLDAHWFSDIVAGAVLTTGWCAAVALWIPAPRRVLPAAGEAERRSPARPAARGRRVWDSNPR